MDDGILPSGYRGTAAGHPFHGPGHDHEYGFPVRDDDTLSERLVIEINQAGLSWLPILRKRERLRRACRGLRVSEGAAFGDEDRARLLGGTQVVRNPLKVDAASFDARAIPDLQGRHGSFSRWLKAHPRWLGAASGEVK